MGNKYIGLSHHNYDKMVYSAILDHDQRFGDVFNADNFFMKYIVLYHNKFSIDDLRRYEISDYYDNLDIPFYHTDKSYSYILVLDNAYIHYKDLENDVLLNKLLNQFHNDLYVIYNSISVYIYIKQNYPDVKLILDTYAHGNNYNKMLDALFDFDNYGVCLDFNFVDLCPHFIDERVDMSRIFMMMSAPICANCDGRKRCMRWKSHTFLPVKHYADYVTPMWEYLPKYLKCYSYMNKNVELVDQKALIMDISERFGLENFLLNRYNNDIFDVIDLFVSDTWREKILCQMKQ